MMERISTILLGSVRSLTLKLRKVMKRATTKPRREKKKKTLKAKRKRKRKEKNNHLYSIPSDNS